MDELPTCNHVIAGKRSRELDRAGSVPSASSSLPGAPDAAAPIETGAPALAGADAGRSAARRVGGGAVGGATAVAAGGPADTITLDADARHRRRVRLESDGGIAFLLDLPSARLLRDGDRLVLSDRRTIEVRAADEALYEVRAGDRVGLLRLAWHVGNRHLPTELREDHLRVRRDPVVGRMLEGLGADVAEVAGGFDPEGGAYAHDHGAGSDHGA